MRINQYVAQATGLSRREADKRIQSGAVTINGQIAVPGDTVAPDQSVSLNGKALHPKDTVTIMLNKPVGFVCSRAGQGSNTIYDLLPARYHHLKPVGRLDKDSSGLLILTNDGNLANRLTHPRYTKQKVYHITLDTPLNSNDQQQIESGIQLDDGISKLALSGHGKTWTVTMSEGRNRQIRRTFTALGYSVTKLHRTHFGSYLLGNIKNGTYVNLK